jgi:hypothetical protein
MRRLLILLLFAASFGLGSGGARAAGVADDGVHLGVASCAGNNCHGAVEPLKASRVQQNEYLIWAQKDKHSRAYAVLKDERSQRIARNLGLLNSKGEPDAENAAICLDCHADNVAPDRRGRQFQLSDGVGCEACHGGSVGWLGIHISGGTHQQNVQAGLYQTDKPLERAERCMTCHVGDDKRLVTHQIMGAGHPPLGFELDTYTAIQPAHYTVDADYVQRKGRPNDVQVWAVGQSMDLRKRMDAILDPKNVPKGLDPELALFDCQACHHAMDQLQWRPRASTGLGPGKLRLYDATAVMLRTISARVAPDVATELSTHMLALHKGVGEGWPAVQREAAAVKQLAEALIPKLAAHEFTKEDAKALADAVIGLGVNGEDLDYSGAQQQTMALQSIVAAMQQLGFADETQVKALNEALTKVGETVANDQTYRPDVYVQALRQVQAKLPP